MSWSGEMSSATAACRAMSSASAPTLCFSNTWLASSRNAPWLARRASAVSVFRPSSMSPRTSVSAAIFSSCARACSCSRVWTSTFMDLTPVSSARSDSMRPSRAGTRSATEVRRERSSCCDSCLERQLSTSRRSRFSAMRAYSPESVAPRTKPRKPLDQATRILLRHHEGRQVYEPAVRKEGAPGEPRAGEPDVVPFTECGKPFGVRGPDQIEEGLGVRVRGRGHPRLERWRLDGIERVGAHQFFEIPREGGGAVEQLEADDLATDGDHGASLPGQRAKGAHVVIELRCAFDVDVGHRERLGLDATGVSLVGDVRPDLGLVRPPLTARAQGVRDALGLAGARPCKERAMGRLEFGTPVDPTPLLDAGHRDHELLPPGD